MGMEDEARARLAPPLPQQYEFARLNPGFDEYRALTERRIPVVLLEPTVRG